ncbi:MAG: glutamate 5-kinase [Lachnospiraceae bacterium]|nr:glutamate 5-kinase [Lachnospiraceae bacterium]
MTEEQLLEENRKIRESLKEKKRIVVKIGSSSVIHEETGGIDFIKLEKLARYLTDLHNQGKDVVLVSSGAIGMGVQALGLSKRPASVARKQACAAVGQGQLIGVYERFFKEYNQQIAQILITKETMIDRDRRLNAKNTFLELLDMGVIPIVNENDTVATEEIEFGDNDTLAAIVCALVKGDLLILLTDIDGFYTDDPHKNPEAKIIPVVEEIDEQIEGMAKGVTSRFGTGGMAAKIAAANICNDSGADMLIASGERADILNKIMQGEQLGTIFKAHKRPDFHLISYLQNKSYLDE